MLARPQPSHKREHSEDTSDNNSNIDLYPLQPDDQQQPYPEAGGSPPPGDTAAAAKRAKPNTKTACDRCRKRKIKCEEERPCSKCKAADEHCVTTALDRIRYNASHLDIKPSEQELSLRKAQKAANKPKSNRQQVASSGTKRSPSSALGSGTLSSGAPPPSSSTSSTGPFPSSHSDTNPWSHGVYIDESGSLVHASSSSGLPLVERLGALHHEEEHDQAAETATESRRSPSYTPHNQDRRTQDPPVDLSSSALVDPYSRDVWSAVQDCIPVDLLHSLLRNHLQTAEALTPILHQPHFTQHYIACCEGNTPCSPAFGGLLMAIAAVSSRSSTHDIRVLADPSNSRSAGLRYFQRSRVLLRLPQDRLSLDYIMALLYLSDFVEGLGDSTLHVMILAEASGLALQTGLHREQSSFDPIQTECRKRTFWALYNLDKVTACAQGRSPLLKIADCNVALPEPCDDRFITSEGVQPQPEDQSNVVHASFNAMTQINVIVEHILVFINAPNQVESDTQTSLLYSFRRSITTSEQHDKSEMLDQAEQFLDRWMMNLPDRLRLSSTLGRVEPEQNPQQFVQSIRLAVTYNFVQGLIARERIVLELNAACEAGTQLAYGQVAQKAAESASTIAQLVGVLDARGLIDKYFSYQHVQHLAFAAHTLLSIMAVYQAVSAEHIQIVERVLSLLEKSSLKFALAVKASQLLRQIAKGLKIHLKVAPSTDYGDRLRVRVVPQARPSYELQRRSSLSSKVDDHDWITLASQGRTNLNSVPEATALTAPGIANPNFNQSSIRGSGGTDSVLPSPQDEYPSSAAGGPGGPSSSYLSLDPSLGATGRSGTGATGSSFRPFNPWSPSMAPTGPPLNSGEMTDLLAPFGLTYVDPLEDNFAANPGGGMRDNLFGIMSNNFAL